MRGEVESDEVCSEGRVGFLEDLEPFLRAEGEENALFGDALDIVSRRNFQMVLLGKRMGLEGLYIFHDHIVRGDTIGCDEEEGLVVYFVQVADFAAGNEGQGPLEVGRCQRRGHCEYLGRTGSRDEIWNSLRHWDFFGGVNRRSMRAGAESEQVPQAPIA